MRLKDKVAIITGGAEGIGKAYALGYAGEGAKVVVADINLPAAETLVNTLMEQGNEALAIRTDVSEAADTGEMVRKTLERFGRIDILVNNAAMFQRPAASRAPVWELAPEEWEKVIKVNLTGVFLCCRAVLPVMIKQQSGKIINIASSLAFLGAAAFSHYSASKGGVITFTRALAREVGKYPTVTNCLEAKPVPSKSNSMATLLLELLATARSKEPVPLKSPATIAVGFNPRAAESGSPAGARSIVTGVWSNPP